MATIGLGTDRLGYRNGIGDWPINAAVLTPPKIGDVLLQCNWLCGCGRVRF